MAGRKPKPTAIKVLEGNPGKRPLNRDEPQAVLAEIRPPRGLSIRARRYWRALAPVLLRMRVLTDADCVLFRKLCEALDDSDRFAEVWRGLGPSYETRNKLGELCIKPRPEFAMFQVTEVRILRYLVELGMSPSSRSRIKVTPEKQVDPFEEFLNVPD